jgi:hypothetical protein
MAKRRELSGVSTFGYIPKVSRAIEGVVGEKWADVIASMAFDRWNAATTVFRDVAHDAYEELAGVLSEMTLTDENGARRYLSVATALSAMAYKLARLHGGVLTDADKEALVALLTYNKNINLPEDKAREVVEVIARHFPTPGSH